MLPVNVADEVRLEVGVVVKDVVGVSVSVDVWVVVCDVVSVDVCVLDFVELGVEVNERVGLVEPVLDGEVLGEVDRLVDRVVLLVDLYVHPESAD